MRYAVAILSLYILLTVVSSPLAYGDEGRNPIWEATTITQSGHYIFTRDVPAAASGPTITISASAVTLDLNGFTLNGNIEIMTGADADITIRNGSTTGSVESSSTGLRLRIQSVDFIAPGFYAVNVSAVRYFEMTECTTADEDVRVVSGFFTGVIRNNRLEAWDPLWLDGFSYGVIEGNIIYASTFVPIYLINGGHNTIRENRVSGAGAGWAEIWINSSCPGNTIVGNTAAAIDIGIQVDSSNNRIVGNLIDSGDYSAIKVGGSNNLVENNVLSGAWACGIEFLNTNGHAYRDNMMTGMLTPVCGSTNIDAGGNIP